MRPNRGFVRMCGSILQPHHLHLRLHLHLPYPQCTTVALLNLYKIISIQSKKPTPRWSHTYLSGRAWLVRASTRTVTPLHAGATGFLLLRTGEHEGDVTRSTTHLRGERYLFAQHLKGKRVFACACKKKKKWRQSRWSLVRFIRAVCSEHIKYSLHTQRNFTEGAMPAIHIHPLHTEAHDQTEGKQTQSVVL